MLSKHFKFKALLISAIFILTIIVPMLSLAQHPVADMAAKSTEYIASNNSYIMNLSIDERSAIIDKAFNDYLSGKTKALIIPGAQRYVEPKNSKWVRPMHDAPIPDFKNISLNPVNAKSTELPVYRYDGGNWSNTYIFFGCDNNKQHNASSVDGRVNCLNNLEDASSGRGFDEYVMHFWSKNSNEDDVENCIQMIRSGSTVTFNFKVNGAWVEGDRGHITRPAGDTFSMYIMAYQPSGQNFNKLEFYIFDVNTWQFYDEIFDVPAMHMFRVDMALEKYYEPGEPRPGNTNVWKWVSNFHVYDYNLQCMNLYSNGFVYELVTPAVTNPSVLNAHYTDFIDYIGTPYAEGTLYMTRYRPGDPYPTHP